MSQKLKWIWWLTWLFIGLATIVLLLVFLPTKESRSTSLYMDRRIETKDNSTNTTSTITTTTTTTTATTTPTTKGIFNKLKPTFYITRFIGVNANLRLR